MNDGTYEGILNQDDVQEYVNGDNAIPFYPERAETVIRADNGAEVAKLQKEIDELRAAVIETCPRLVNESDADCLRRTVSELRADLESETRWAKQYHDDWIAARAELERVKAEIRRRETGGTSSVAEINAIHELKREKAEVERGELHADNRSMLILKIGLRASRLHDLFKCANAAKRQMRRERDAALRCLKHNNDAQVVLAQRNENFLRENMIEAQRQRKVPFDRLGKGHRRLMTITAT